MAARIIIKIYAALHPAGAHCIACVRQAGAGAIPESSEPWLFLEHDLLRISFEGLYFPEDDVLKALDTSLPTDACGKMDVLDLETWELRRYTRHDGKFSLVNRDLNHVLGYAEHAT